MEKMTLTKEKLQEWLRVLKDTEYLLGAYHCNWSVKEIEDFLKSLLEELERKQTQEARHE